MIEPIFRSDLIAGATLVRPYDMPALQRCTDIPEHLVSLSNAKRTRNHRQWIHFYENDDKIIGFIRRPKQALKFVRLFDGIIMPDLSVYTDAPYPVAMYSSYINKAVAWWFQHQGIRVIPNVRFGSDKIDAFTFCGIPQKSVIAVSYTGIALGTENIRNDQEELEMILQDLNPMYIIFYGPVPAACISICLFHKVLFHIFENDTHRAYRKIRERGQKMLVSGTEDK